MRPVKHHDPENELREAIRAAAGAALDLDAAALESIPLTWPPKPELGDLASPICFELAKVAKRAPRQLAEAIVERFEPRGDIARLEAWLAPRFALVEKWSAGDYLFRNTTL